ncbi:MAG: ParB N-terminal domain-containing protein, partial [Elusimicrobia bacterium]|nr:ParB N-terminal domain-containing protein [Elusimicrobiota bacterium]
MQTTPVPIDGLKFSDYNPRAISTHDFESLKRSIREFGFVEPIVANRHPGRENVIVGGHQRVRAAKTLGLAEIPVVYVDLPLEQERLLNLALNRIKGDWQEDQLVQLIGQIEDGQDLGLTGFTDQELDKLLYGALDAGG